VGADAKVVSADSTAVSLFGDGTERNAPTAGSCLCGLYHPSHCGMAEQIPVFSNWRKEHNTMKAEYRNGCLQRDSVERKGYAGVQSVATRENKERDNATKKLVKAGYYVLAVDYKFKRLKHYGI